MFRESVSVSDFKVSNIQPTSLDKKESKNGGQGQTFVYFDGPINYKYEHGARSTVDRLQVVCGSMMFPNGIQEGRPQPSGVRSAPSLRINLNDSEEGEKLARVLEDIHDFAAGVLHENTKMLSEVKGSKVPRTRDREAWKDRDGLGEPYIKGDNGITKMKYVPLMEFEGKIKTNFRIMSRDSDGNLKFETMNPLLLIGKPVEMVITLFVKRIYVSAALSQYKVQIFLSSAIVGKIIENHVSPAELRAAQRLAESVGAEALAQNKTHLVAGSESPENKTPRSEDLNDPPCERPEWGSGPSQPAAACPDTEKPEPSAPVVTKLAAPAKRGLRAPSAIPPRQTDSDGSQSS